MDIHVATAFPGMLAGPLQQSILKQAKEKNLADYHIYDLRDFAEGKHRQIDDYPYGGGPGMVLKPEPIIRCVEAILEKCLNKSCLIILLTPQGETFKQKLAHEFTKFEHLIFVCGHYKGIDERVRQHFLPREISIGNYVLSSGEIAALVMIDSVVRLIPGVLNDFDSAASDSFESELVDYPHYTRPAVFRNMAIPDVLLSGNHAEIKKWRQLKSIEKTEIKKKRETFGDGFGND
jgi:tRNA (guanine37-N1)-methyltransferase